MNKKKVDETSRGCSGRGAHVTYDDMMDRMKEEADRREDEANEPEYLRAQIIRLQEELRATEEPLSQYASLLDYINTAARETGGIDHLQVRARDGDARLLIRVILDRRETVIAGLRAQATEAYAQYKKISDDDDATIAELEADIARLRAAVEARDDAACEPDLSCGYCCGEWGGWRDNPADQGRHVHKLSCPTVTHPLDPATTTTKEEPDGNE